MFEFLSSSLLHITRAACLTLSLYSSILIQRCLLYTSSIILTSSSTVPKDKWRGNRFLFLSSLVYNLNWISVSLFFWLLTQHKGKDKWRFTASPIKDISSAVSTGYVGLFVYALEPLLQVSRLITRFITRFIILISWMYYLKSRELEIRKRPIEQDWQTSRYLKAIMHRSLRYNVWILWYMINTVNGLET